jgi:hypothetical protein
VPVVKTPDERGPLGAWAYETRVRLELSVEAVAAAIPQPVNPATIRKAEGESRNMSRPLWRQLTAHYARIAREQGVTISQPPTYGDVPAPADQAALIAQISALVEELRLTRLEQTEWNRGVTEALALLAQRLPLPAPTDGPEPVPSSGARR